jgi:hypothetical protein
MSLVSVGDMHLTFVFRRLFWIATAITLGGCRHGETPDERFLREQGFRSAGTLDRQSLIAGVGDEAAVYVNDSLGVTILAYRSEADASAMIVAGEAIITLRDTTRSAELENRIDRASRTSALRPSVARRVAGAGAPGVYSPADLASAIDLNGLDATLTPNAVVRMLSNQDQNLGTSAVEQYQWSMRNWGKDGTRTDADVDGAESVARIWYAAKPQTRVAVVGVIDSGVDTTHAALHGSLWRNPGEIPDNGKDDDGDGKVDDVVGWNFADYNSDVADRDSHGHGTHVAGIIAARAVPGLVPVYGMSPNTRLMVIRIPLKSTLIATEFGLADGLYFAIDHGADIVNMSVGSFTKVPAVELAIWEGTRKGMIMVAAAGNDGIDVGTKAIYPCVIGGVICVVATDANDEVASFSNYSASWTHIAAPGTDILSTKPGGGFQGMSGTSMATPLVSGALAATFAIYPDIPASERRARVIGLADSVATLGGKVGSSRRLNAWHALFDPPPVSETTGLSDYCAERVPGPTGQSYPRWTNYPYANSGEPRIDGSQINRAFTICTTKQLVNIQKEDLGKIFVLMQDIVWKRADGVQQIGAEITTGGTIIHPFTGNFFGWGYSIIGMYSRGKNQAGLFGHIARGGRVNDLNFRSADIEATTQAGVVATLNEGTITNVLAEGTVRSPLDAGGLVAVNRGTIQASLFEGTVAGGRYAGGLAAEQAAKRYIATGFVTHSSFRGTLSGGTVGGIAGILRDNGSISASHALTRVSTASVAGGLVGALQCDAHISNSYAEGEVEDAARSGGLAATLINARLERAYAMMRLPNTREYGGAVGKNLDGLQVTTGGPLKYVCTGTSTAPPPSTLIETFYNSSFVGKSDGGLPRSWDELRQQSTFNGWFRNNTWMMSGGGTPALRQIPRSPFWVHPNLIPLHWPTPWPVPWAPSVASEPRG